MVRKTDTLEGEASADETGLDASLRPDSFAEYVGQTAVVERLKEVLAAHPGTTDVHLQLEGGGKTTVVRLGDGLRVTAAASLFADLKQLLGAGCLPAGA